MKYGKNKWKQFRYTQDPDRIIAAVVGKKYEEYRDKWKRAEDLVVVQRYPIHIDFELQFGCNLKCPHCILQINANEFACTHPYHISKRNKKINFEKYIEIIREGVPYGLSSITLSVNNEPLLVPGLSKYINAAKKEGILDIILLTNAATLTKEMSSELLESGLTKIYFSLDAIKEETYKKVRTGGDYKKVMENIDYFLRLKRERRLKLPITRVSFVKNKINEAEEEEFVKYWEDKVDFVSVQAFVTPAYGYSTYPMHQQTFQIGNDELKNMGPCPQPYQRMTIYNDGSVHPCCHWYGAMLDMGNIHKESIYDIWNSRKMELFRTSANSKTVSEMAEACRICREAVFGGKL